MKVQVSPAITFCLTAFLLSEPAKAQEPATPVPEMEAYESWKMAKSGTRALTEIQAPKGFTVELIREAKKNEDSWVGMTFDDEGRLFLGMEKKGILRLSFTTSENQNPPQVSAVEVVNEDLEECRGLLWAYDSLYANANDSKGFYRLRDTNGDDRFDEKKLLLATGGGVGHGRNHLRLGPDGMIYLTYGNDPQLAPENDSPDSPFKNWGEDQLIPNPWDDSWNKLPAPAGYILKTDKDGSSFVRLCGGLRNPLDMDFNRDGEIFVYDADSEWDAGLAWYKPTRVLHIVSGGEYGWRRGTGKWPAYYPDSLPSSIDIGLGSPTGVGFACESNFPPEWRDTFMIADWSYGRVLAVTLSPDGASYTGKKKTFLSGRPLNLTDFVFHKGDMWFITGGRKTQSALYRVRWTGEKTDTPNKDTKITGELSLRRELEKYHTQESEEGLQLALNHLDHGDRFIAFAARVALENQPVKRWRQQVESSGNGLLALARVGDKSDQAAVISQTLKLIQEGKVADSTLLTLLRTLQLTFIRHGEPDTPTRERVREAVLKRFPGPSRPLNHEFVELLVYLKAPGIIDPILALAETSGDTRDWSHYLTFLRYIDDEWTTGERKRYLTVLRRFEEFPGGRWYVRTAQDLRSEALASLTEQQKNELAELLAPAQPAVAASPVTVDPEVFVANWKLSDFAAELRDGFGTPDEVKGRAAYHKAGCAACHRLTSDAATNLAILGPDLTGIAMRFDPRTILESIIHPSRVIGDKYQNPAAPNLSTMPPGLINGLEKEEIVQLVSYLLGKRENEPATPQ
ncbi:MAG: c-type cytochrome [Verrucomicrobiales bacterium]|nr:c-type cytochrome [Verrucomicrobiales bacterium]